MATHSPLQSSPGGELKELYDAESSRLQHDFSSTKNGLNYLRERTALVESVLLRVAAPFLSSEAPGNSGIVLVAVGDFGRRSLFPYSDIDILVLPAAREGADHWKGAIERFSQGMFAAGLKINATTKSLAEFSEFDSENTESILSLLDCRFLAGDRELFSNLRDKLIPEIMAQESQVLAERLAEMTRNRHRKFANTVFHLEPDVRGRPRRISRLHSGVLARGDVRDGTPARLARSGYAAFSRDSKYDGPGLRISSVGALLSRFSPHAQ